MDILKYEPEMIYCALVKYAANICRTFTSFRSAFTKYAPELNEYNSTEMSQRPIQTSSFHYIEGKSRTKPHSINKNHKKPSRNKMKMPKNAKKKLNTKRMDIMLLYTFIIT